MSLGYFLNSTAKVSQTSDTTSSMGAIKKVWTTRIASLRCRFRAKKVQETDDYGKVTVQNLRVLYCDASTTNKAIEESDKITFNSIDYQITGIYNPGFLDRHLEIQLTETR